MESMLRGMETINNVIGFEEHAKSYVQKNHVLNEDKIMEIGIYFDLIAGSEE